MLSRTCSLVALLAVAIPLTAEAQGRGFRAGGGSREADALIRGLEGSPSLSKDLQKANPIEILLDKKKVIGMTPDEEKELKTINSTLKESIKPYLKTIDSVSREMKKTGAYAPTQGQMLIGRRLTRESSDSVRVHYTSASDEAMEKLAEERRQPAMEALKKEMETQTPKARGGRPPM